MLIWVCDTGTQSRPELHRFSTLTHTPEDFAVVSKPVQTPGASQLVDVGLWLIRSRYPPVRALDM